MLRFAFSESSVLSNAPYCTAMSRCAKQRLEYFESTFSEIFAFSGSERVKSKSQLDNLTILMLLRKFNFLLAL